MTKVIFGTRFIGSSAEASQARSSPARPWLGRIRVTTRTQ